MLRDHLIDLSATYAIDDAVYFRFRLYADGATHGWGWAFDDVQATNTVSAIEETGKPVQTYALMQNYPNPFNPNTVIRYQLPVHGFVQIDVYNMLGQRVRTLVNKMQPAGIYSVLFNGNGLASGVYYYRLTIGNRFTAVRKMLLVE
jgi:hypothetical protein